ncbi:MAG: ClpXP protease specificity-enhancing factor SspB [Pseudomonadota bacterium]
MTKDQINYPLLIDQAMRGVVRDVLRLVQSTGLPGNHHFYVSYSTLHPGVRMSEQLRAKYPKEITIVIQHQFWDFKVEDQQFHVTLSFGGVPEKLTIPFAALTAFADPSIKFGLQFQQSEMFENGSAMSAKMEEPISEDVVFDAAASSEDKIISLDAFRKK